MTNFTTMLIAIFMVMFWLFRAIVALCTQFSVDLLGIVAYDLNMEIIIAFATIICIVLIVKRKLIGVLAYMLIYGMYFGEHLFMNIMPLIQGQGAMSMDMVMNLLCDFIAILLVIFAFFDLLIDKSRKANPIDKKTDWYFKNQKYEDELNARDKRDDNNQYKFY
ncbi:MAG: hypothetical protein HFJ55_07730 [Clostridia bacterium]|jgi:hypothetical protein|nr:hypothetical protein [Clostridia bacterium]